MSSLHTPRRPKGDVTPPLKIPVPCPITLKEREDD